MWPSQKSWTLNSSRSFLFKLQFQKATSLVIQIFEESLLYFILEFLSEFNRLLPHCSNFSIHQLIIIIFFSGQNSAHNVEEIGVYPHCLALDLDMNGKKTRHNFWCVPGMLGSFSCPEKKDKNKHRMSPFWDDPIYPPK